MAKPALGRGLGALLGGAPAAGKPATPSPSPAPPEQAPASAPPGDKVLQLEFQKIRPCPLQPRKDFTQESLNELADSIKAQGILQPLVVRPQADHYELIAGERRWRAAQLAGLQRLPVIIRQADDRAVLELALIENLQRENLNPIEEAQGFNDLMSRFDLRQEDVATKVGKSRAAVANALRLLKLPPEVLAHVREGRLSVGHAKVILGLENPQKQILAAEEIIKAALNVRQTEELVARLQNPAPSSKPLPVPDLKPQPQPHVMDLENRLRERLATKVMLRYNDGKGSLEIKFFNDNDLERILQVMGVTVD